MPQLPLEIWRRRVESEYAEVKSRGLSFDVSADHTEYVFHLAGSALRKDGDAITAANRHDVSVRIKREYPYAGGFELLWLTPIFHPNIDEKGKVCIRLVNKWAEGQTLASLVDALLQLLRNPNPESPLNFEAAQYYLENPTGEAPAKYRLSRPRIL